MTFVHLQKLCEFVENKTEDVFSESQVCAVNKIDKMEMYQF